MLLDQPLEMWLSLGREQTFQAESRSPWTPSPQPRRNVLECIKVKMTSPSLFSPGCKFICQMKTLYSNGSISELISQSLPFQGKRFPATFDLQNVTDLRMEDKSGCHNWGKFGLACIGWTLSYQFLTAFLLLILNKDYPYCFQAIKIFHLQRVNSSISVSDRKESQTLKSVKLP